MSLSKEDFIDLIPHSGNMCLIDQVSEWNEEFIHCCTFSHLAADNPLKDANGFSTIMLLEYGAQAMAIHGGILSGQKKPGFLAVIRDAILHSENINHIKKHLLINANAIGLSTAGAMYSFQISANNETLLEASATVINT